MITIKDYLEDPCCNPPTEIDKYLNGNCEIFAVAGNRILGWNIVAITEIRLVDGLTFERCLVHAFLIPPNHKFSIFDAKGIRCYKQLNKEYPLDSNVSLESITEKELIDLVHFPKDIKYRKISYEEIEIEIKEAEIFIKTYYKLDS